MSSWFRKQTLGSLITVITVVTSATILLAIEFAGFCRGAGARFHATPYVFWNSGLSIPKRGDPQVATAIHNDSPSYRFRSWGFLLGVLFHLVMFVWAFTSENALAGGYRFLLTWYLPSIVLGLPWSIPAMFLDALVPGFGMLGLAAAVCFNGYLLGWLLDAIVKPGR